MLVCASRFGSDVTRTLPIAQMSLEQWFTTQAALSKCPPNILKAGVSFSLENGRSGRIYLHVEVQMGSEEGLAQ